jgi:hypothetical protein
MATGYELAGKRLERRIAWIAEHRHTRKTPDHVFKQLLNVV